MSKPSFRFKGGSNVAPIGCIALFSAIRVEYAWLTYELHMKKRVRVHVCS